MTSIFQHALGVDVDRLHPMLQRRFGVGLDAGYGCVGRGTMAQIRRGPWWKIPFLRLGKIRNILIPDLGVDVPFTIENYPYLDPFGRETITFVREYRVRRKLSRFDATMILDYVAALRVQGCAKRTLVGNVKPLCGAPVFA